jgi:signal transduction histidine kinase
MVLLDVNMPEMNGYEVCEQLKLDACLAEVPVIFISALGEIMDKVRGFAAGGVDYITKPFQIDDVRARVAAHLELCRQRRELRDSYEKLRKLERMREDLVSMIVHDLRSPLAAICTYLELLREEAKGKLGSASCDDIEHGLHAAHNMMRLINGVLDVSKMEAEMMKLDRAERDLVELVGQSLEALDSLVGGRTLAFDHPPTPVKVPVDEEVVTRIVQNLLANALRFTPAGGEIRVGIAECGRDVRVSVADTGPGIAPEFRERVFDKFAQAEAYRARKRMTTGLGLTFCKLAVEAHNGSIGVDSEPGKGSTFWFTLPRPPS